jgi:initiation factor 1A
VFIKILKKMVKNTHGGSGHKKFGRKFTNTSGTGGRLRVSECEDEMFAIVTKMCGNNMVHVHCLDNGSRLCYIRGKFTGRRKKDNFVSVGTWVLVGLREYDATKEAIAATSLLATASSAKTKLPGCDLLEVYTSSEKEQLKSNVEQNWNVLISHDTSTLNKEGEKNGENNNDDVRFTTDRDDDLESLLLTSTSVEKIGISGGDEKEIDLDCI